MRIQLWLVMMLWASFSFAQDGEPATGATTEVEYNYCATGYKLQLQMELPMKKGYVLNNITTVQEGDRTIEFKGLMRKGDKKPCAILMVYSKPRMAPLYFGIPSSDAPSTLWTKYYTSLNSDTENEKDVFRFFSYALGKLTAVMAQYQQ